METILIKTIKSLELKKGISLANNLESQRLFRLFEDFIYDLSINMDTSLAVGNKYSEPVYFDSTSYTIAIKASDIRVFYVKDLYPALLYNHYKNTDIPIMTVFNYVYEEYTSNKCGDYKEFIKRILNFFYGYSLSNVRKYKTPNLASVVKVFFENLPKSVIAYDVDVFFVKNRDVEIFSKYLSDNMLRQCSEEEDNPLYNFIDKSLLVYFIQKGAYIITVPNTDLIYDKSRFTEK